MNEQRQAFDNRGQVSLWKPESDNPNAPVLSGTYVAHRDIKEGESLDISLWRSTSAHERAPALTGKVTDKWEAKSTVTNAAPVKPIAADDIPF